MRKYTNIVYILIRLTEVQVYGNLTKLCSETEMDYNKAYRGIKTRGYYSEGSSLVLKKEVVKSKKIRKK